MNKYDYSFFVGVVILKEKMSIDELNSLANDINTKNRDNDKYSEWYVCDREDIKPGYNLIYKMLPVNNVLEMFSSIIDSSNQIKTETIMEKANRFMQEQNFDQCMPILLERLGFGTDSTTMVIENELLFELGYL